MSPPDLLVEKQNDMWYIAWEFWSLSSSPSIQQMPRDSSQALSLNGWFGFDDVVVVGGGSVYECVLMRFGNTQGS
jgi:hypothetical protein